MSSFPGQGTKILHAAWHGQKEKRKKEKRHKSKNGPCRISGESDGNLRFECSWGIEELGMMSEIFSNIKIL